jgi:hypothetical protein
MLVSFASAEIEQRWRWFAEMRSKINVTCETLGVSTAQLRDLPVYEDAGADAAMTLRLTPSISAALDDLAELIVRTQPLAYPQPRQATMREFFERTYPDRSSVPLLEFYETFYREHYKEFRERELDVMQQRLPDGDLFNPLKLDSVEQIRSVQRAILGLFRDAWSVSPEAVEVDVSRQQLVRVLEPLRRPSEAEFSVSVFCQGVASRCCEEDSVRLVVPNAQYTLGYGKYFSRFLPLVHEGLTTLVRETNRAMGSATLAEITADGNFNGNYHPQLVEHDIHYPTTESLAQGTIRCDQLVVERHDAESQLRLRETKSGEPVIPLDLGFLTQMQRPPLFQLLTWFNTSGTLSLPLPETLAKPAQGDGVSEDGGDPKPIEYRPRITYNGTVVVARRRWAIPSVLFPKPYPDERDHEYFIRLNSWREQHTIPSQVFAKVLASERPGSKPNEAESAEPLPQRNEEETPSVPARPRVRRSQDFRKPQFIDFESPLLVKLFPKLPADLEKFTVVLEERYPTADDLPHTAMGRHACELVLQLSRSWRGDPTCMRQTCAGQVDFAGVSNEAPKASMLTTS